MAIIHIFGASGSGTTTLAKAIAETFDYVFLDTDDFFWEQTNPPFQKKRPVEKRLKLLRNKLYPASRCGTNIVLSGSLCGWGDSLMPLFDLALRVITPTETRIERIKARESARFGDRIQKGGDLYHTHQNFITWAAQYDTGDLNMRSKANHDNWQKLLRCPVIPVDGSLETDNTLLSLSSRQAFKGTDFTSFVNYQKVITQADKDCPNTIPLDTKLNWVKILEVKMEKRGIPLEKQPDDLYLYWLCAQICFVQGEITKHSNKLALYNLALESL